MQPHLSCPRSIQIQQAEKAPQGGRAGPGLSSTIPSGDADIDVGDVNQAGDYAVFTHPSIVRRLKPRSCAMVDLLRNSFPVVRLA